MNKKIFFLLSLSSPMQQLPAMIKITPVAPIARTYNYIDSLPQDIQNMFIQQLFDLQSRQDAKAALILQNFVTKKITFLEQFIVPPILDQATSYPQDIAIFLYFFCRTDNSLLKPKLQELLMHSIQTCNFTRLTLLKKCPCIDINAKVSNVKFSTSPFCQAIVASDPKCKNFVFTWQSEVANKELLEEIRDYDQVELEKVAADYKVLIKANHKKFKKDRKIILKKVKHAGFPQKKSCILQ
jgi:hypothetical protein